MSVALLHLIITMVGLGVLGVSALLALIRIARGPSILDRVVGTDVLIAVVIAALVLEAVVHRHSTTVPIMLVLSLVGFAAAVSVARLVAAREAPRMRHRRPGHRLADDAGDDHDEKDRGEGTGR